MRNHTPTLRLAPIALAAVLASATPALAQDTVTAAPAPAAVPATTPIIVLPTPPEPAPSAVASPAPSMAATAPAAAPARIARATATRTQAPALSAAPVPTAHSAAPAATPLAVTPVAPVLADPLPQVQPAPVDPVAVAPAPVAVATPADSSGNDLALAGLAGILALGGIGIAASRRRSRNAVADEAYAEDDATTAPLVFDEPVAAPPIAAAPASPMAAGAGSLALSQVPETPAARAEFLDQMMNAQPDEANPFHTPKARRRRARLILQGMIARQEQRGEPARSEGRSGPSYDWNRLRPASVPARAYEDA